MSVANKIKATSIPIFLGESPYVLTSQKVVALSVSFYVFVFPAVSIRSLALRRDVYVFVYPGKSLLETSSLISTRFPWSI